MAERPDLERAKRMLQPRERKDGFMTEDGEWVPVPGGTVRALVRPDEAETIIDYALTLEARLAKYEAALRRIERGEIEVGPNGIIVGADWIARAALAANA